MKLDQTWKDASTNLCDIQMSKLILIQKHTNMEQNP